MEVGAVFCTNAYLEDLLLAEYDRAFDAGDPFNGVLSDIGEVVGGATPSKKNEAYYCASGIAWITPRDLSGTTDKFISHGAEDITEAGYKSCSARLMPVGSVLFKSRAPIGYVAIASGNVTTNQGFKSIIPKKEIGTAFTYYFLLRNKQRISDMGAGTTFPEVSAKMMQNRNDCYPCIQRRGRNLKSCDVAWMHSKDLHSPCVLP